MTSWEEILGNVERHGWTVEAVARTDKHPSYAYTIGMCEYKKPDLFIIGMAPKMAIWGLNELCKRMVILGGVEGIDAEIVNDLANFPLKLRMMPPNNPMILAHKYAQEKKIEITALQVTFPDRTGLFPWESGCLDEFASMQNPARFAIKGSGSASQDRITSLGVSGSD